MINVTLNIFFNKMQYFQPYLFIVIFSDHIPSMDTKLLVGIFQKITQKLRIATRKISYGGILLVHNIYYDMLQLFSTFTPLHIYFNGRCLSNQQTRTNIIINATSPNVQHYFFVALFFCNALNSFSAFLLCARSACYMGSSDY